MAMKRLFLALSVLFAAVACGPNEEPNGGNNANDGQGGDTPTIYAVGDLYDANGVQGVVFAISEGGAHGKIVSVTEPSKKLEWAEANAWCSGQGEGWYCPNIDELVVLHSVSTVINTTLEGVGAEKIKPQIYWSSEPKGKDYAYYVSMISGESNHASTGFTALVRAVSVF